LRHSLFFISVYKPHDREKIPNLHDIILCNMIKSRQKSSGFTLIEVLVAITIIGILAGVITINFVSSGQQSRDAKRQSDLQSLQNAVELYKNKYGRYPEQCAGGSGGWSGQLGTDYACADGTNRYILGNVSEGREFAEFMPQLPIDPRLNGMNSGYIYRTNADGTVYKIKSHRTVESENVTFIHEFKPCDIRVGSDPNTGSLSSGSGDIEEIGWCGRVQHNAGSLPSECRYTNESWRKSYGVWGGFASLVGANSFDGLSNALKISAVRNTTNVICR